MRLLDQGLLLVSLVVFSRPSHAYLDPSSSNMLFQAAAALVIGSWVTIRMSWSRLRAFFGAKPPQAALGSEKVAPAKGPEQDTRS